MHTTIVNPLRRYRAVCVGLTLAVIAAPAGAKDTAPRRSPATAEAAVQAQFAAALLAETNRVRHEHGKLPLKALPPLDAAADDQASWNALRLDFSHNSPLPNQATPIDRMRRHGLEPDSCAENVAMLPVGEGETIASPAEVVAKLVDAWMQSPGHRDNLLNPKFTHLGGAVRIVRGPSHVWYACGVQDFVRM